MNITVLHGSPKGEISVTMQYVKFLVKKLPEHSWNIECVGAKIGVLEKDAAAFAAVIEKVQSADIVLWSFPVYHLLVPAQFKRFIELVSERGAADAFAGKYSAALMTSIHYFDHVARNYIHAVSEDLGMKFSGAFTPEMHDLSKKSVRKNIVLFAERFIADCTEKAMLPVSFAPVKKEEFVYRASTARKKIPSENLRVRIIYDSSSAPNVSAMVKKLASSFDNVISTDLSSFFVKGGCLGCLKCGARGKCAYDGSDGYRDFHQKMIMDADIIFFAGAIRDRYLSAKFKTFFDRSFYLNHQPVFEGKQVGWLVSGPLSAVSNLRQIMETYPEISHGNLTGIVTDEVQDSAELDARIDTLASRAVSNALRGYVAPETFLANAGRRLFRDEIWGGMRIVFSADYTCYRKKGMFDFPTRKLVNRTIVPLAALLLKIPALRKGFDRNIKQGMIAGLKKIVDNA